MCDRNLDPQASNPVLRLEVRLGAFSRSMNTFRAQQDVFDHNVLVRYYAAFVNLSTKRFAKLTAS